MPEQTIPKERTSHIPGLDPEVTPLLGLGLGLTGLALGLRPRLAALPLALTALTAALYRDPERATPSEPGSIFAPADGVVLRVDELYEHRFVHSDCLRLSVDIGPLDVPVIRSPAIGLVRLVEQVSGEYRPASDPEAGDRNERIYIGLETDWGPLLIALVAGPIGRRLVCRVRVGDRLEAGTRLGTARFGARADLYVQRDVARLTTGPGMRLVAGITRIGAVVPL
ncbi:MAG: phosphatidylserine decarboxylase [Chloroflexales bacterium]|nr:phosphatidylserine decarboxylase [Chloroflexales bacterium]